MARYDDFGYPRYVSVAERRHRAEAKAAKLSRAGEELAPIRVAGRGRKIACSFWGQAWCSNLEAYSDYANRLPRGRTYVRNGSVIDLKIEGGRVRAKVSGSSLYSVDIAIEAVDAARWDRIKSACGGGIPSLLELLQGQLSDEIMQVVTNKGEGLFPSPSEIQLSCSCPDWASMCKHVAATLYGVGVRLDEAPELLFTLRGVDPEALVTAAVDATAPEAGASSDRKVLDDEGLSSIFGVDIDLDPVGEVGEPAPREARRATPAREAKSPSSKAALDRLRSRVEVAVRDCEILDAVVDRVRLTRGRIYLSMGPGIVLARLTPASPRTVRVETKAGSKWESVDRGTVPAVLRRLREALTED